MQRAARDMQHAVDRQNRRIRDYNSKVAKAVNEYNRDVRQYNAKVKAHNQKVENQRRRLQQEIRRLSVRPATVSVTYRTSVQALASSYEAVETRLGARDLNAAERELLDRASVEAANSAYLTNALEGDSDPGDDTTEDELRSPSMTVELAQFSNDLVMRWTGALFALSPKNPDAARHFCTSVREVLTSLLDIAAPDSGVLVASPDCSRTEQGTPTRRAKIRHLLSRKRISDVSLDAFVEADIDNVLSLFRMFNDGTHGHAGRFSIAQLTALRTRVESAIAFVHSIAT